MPHSLNASAVLETAAGHPENPIVGAFLEVLAQERDSLETILGRLRDNPESIQSACELLRRATGTSRVIVSGIGKAGLIARKVAATLSSVGTPSVFVHPVEALHGDLGFVHPEDRGLLFSYSGETVELARLAFELSRLGCQFIAVTRSRSSTLGRSATVCLELGTVDEACYLGLAPTSSTTAMLAVGDALAVSVARSSGFGPEDFGRNHPAGALGLSFRNVAQTMRVGSRLVLVSPQSSVAEVVRRVTESRTGAAILVDSDGGLAGIFTDGDLRRTILFDRDALSQAVGAHASMPCQSISASASLADALRLFHNARVEDLPVVDGESGRVVGHLCMKDIALI